MESPILNKRNASFMNCAHVGAVLVYYSSDKTRNMQKGTIKIFILLGFIMSTLGVLAQDTTITTTSITESETLWYMEPWVWIVGGVVVLLLLIALFSGGKAKDKNSSRTDKVIITKTVRTETDVDD
jgi:hypothetical protein